MAHERKDLARVTVDTTVQPKDMTFPTDAKLLHAAIKGLTRAAADRPKRLLKKTPIHRPRQLHQPVFHIDDLVKP